MVNQIVIIDLMTSGVLLLAIVLALFRYYKTLNKGQTWLLVTSAFFFVFIAALSNVLEWMEITAAFDPAEDFLNMLVAFVFVYLWYQER